jgi:hypothetical protein
MGAPITINAIMAMFKEDPKVSDVGITFGNRSASIKKLFSVFSNNGMELYVPITQLLSEK